MNCGANNPGKSSQGRPPNNSLGGVTGKSSQGRRAAGGSLAQTASAGKFRRQVPFGSYIVDFYCAEKKLVVEVDGGVHDSQVEYDSERTAWLESNGLKVIRVRDEDVMYRLDAVLDEIWNAFDL